MQPQCPYEGGNGAKKLFQSASLFICYCSSAIGQFLTLKNQSEKQAIALLFKVQISPDHPSSNKNLKKNMELCFTYIPLFVNFTVLSMEFPIRYCLPFIFQTNWNFYQIILTHTQGRSQGRSPNKSLIKKLQMSSEIKLLARTKVYYCFNSNGDNFKVNQL